MIGEAIDDALLARDEMANRVWAIARLLEGEDGRSRAPAVNAAPDTTTATSAEDDADYRYRMANDAPAAWAPLTLQIAADGRRLLRERNAATDTLLTRLLPEGAAVCDEEVGRDGVSLRIETSTRAAATASPWSGPASVVRPAVAAPPVGCGSIRRCRSRKPERE